MRSYVSSREIVSNSTTATSLSDTRNNCFDLFRSCFQGIRRNESLEDIVEDDVKEFDYVVEKLVVKRVPFMLLSMPRNTVYCTGKPSKNPSRSLMNVNTIYSPASDTQSLLYYSDKFDQNNPLFENPDKCSHFDGNENELNERYKNRMLPNDYHTRLKELMKTMSSLHPDLKEHERLPKDPCPLNMPKNRSTSSTKTYAKVLLDRDKESQEQKVFQSRTSNLNPKTLLKEKEDESVSSYGVKSNNEQKVYNLNQLQYVALDDLQHHGTFNSEKFLVQPVQEISCNSANYTEPVIDVVQMNREDSDSQINNVHQSLVNESEISEKIVNTNPSNTVLKWKIVVKHCRPRTFSKESQEMTKYFNTC
ncbi:hypothetical protein ANTPLA_LOCUS7808 [Anthophora plagiata]